MAVWLLTATAALATLFLRGWEDSYVGPFLILAGTGMILAGRSNGVSGMLWLAYVVLMVWLSCTFGKANLTMRPEWFLPLSENPAFPKPKTVSVAPALSLYWLFLLGSSGLLFLFLLSQPLSPRGAGAISYLIGLGLAGYAAFSLLLELEGFEWVLDASKDSFGLLPNRNHSASLLALGAILLTGHGTLHLMKKRYGVGGVSLIAVSVIMFALAGVSSSRAGILLTLLGILSWLTLQRIPRWKVPVRVTVLALTLTCGITLMISGTESGKRLRDLGQKFIDDTGTDGEKTPPIDFRIWIYQDTMKLITDAPITGWGLGTFRYVMPFYRDKSISCSEAIHPESDWLLLAAEGGWPAVALLFFVILYLFWCSRKLRHRPEWMVMSAGLCSVGAGLLHGLIDVPLHRPATGWIFLIIAGLVFGRARLQAHQRKPAAWRLFETLLFKAGGACLLAAGIFVIWDGRKDVPRLGEGSIGTRSEQILELYNEGKFQAAEHLARSSIHLHPMHEIFYQQLGTIMAGEEGRDDEIDNIFKVARQLDPWWPLIAFDQGRVWLDIDSNRTLERWREAIERTARLEGKMGCIKVDSILRQMLVAARRQPAVYRQLFHETIASGIPHAMLEWVRIHEGPVETVAFLRITEEAGTSHELLEFWFSKGEKKSLLQFLSRATDEERRQSGMIFPKLLVELRNDFENAVHEAMVNYPAMAGSIQNQDESPALKQIRDLEGAGNTVAARRIYSEALQGRTDAGVMRVEIKRRMDSGEWSGAWELLEVYAREYAGDR